MRLGTIHGTSIVSLSLNLFVLFDIDFHKIFMKMTHPPA